MTCDPIGVTMRTFLGFLLLVCCLICLSQTKGQDEPPVVKPKPIAKDKPATLPTDVPVVPSKVKQTEISEQGIVPVNMIRNRVENIQPGRVSYVSLDTIRVDANRRCWLHPHALTGTKKPDRPIEVRRDADGFHVTIENVDHQWEAADFDTSSGWLPVKTITVR